MSSEFSWSAFPALERSGPAALGLAVIVMTSGAIAIAGGSVAWGILAVLVLLAALNRFYFRSTYSIDAEGITAHYLLRSKRFQWRDVRRFMSDEHGGFLSTRDRPSRLDAFRGMHVLFGTEREQVVERIHAHLSDPGAETAA